MLSIHVHHVEDPTLCEALCTHLLAHSNTHTQHTDGHSFTCDMTLIYMCDVTQSHAVFIPTKAKIDTTTITRALLQIVLQSVAVCCSVLQFKTIARGHLFQFSKTPTRISAHRVLLLQKRCPFFL